MNTIILILIILVFIALVGFLFYFLINFAFWIGEKIQNKKEEIEFWDKFADKMSKS
jgi:hypothetical protein